MKTTTKVICYKTYLGKWFISDLKPTQRNLAFVKKTLAENGVAVIQEIGK